MKIVKNIMYNGEIKSVYNHTPKETAHIMKINDLDAIPILKKNKGIEKDNILTMITWNNLFKLSESDICIKMYEIHEKYHYNKYGFINSNLSTCLSSPSVTMMI